MNRKDLSFLNTMFEKNNINEINALVINQCTNIELPEIECPHDNIRVISVKEEGLSKSRNLGLRNAKGDIVLPTDDDVVYESGIVEVIREAFAGDKNIDVISFQYRRQDSLSQKNYLNKEQLHTRKTIRKVCSIEIAINREALLRNNIYYDELFGLGAKYNSGEENIFLGDCMKKGLQLKFKPICIALHPPVISGLTLDEKQLYGKGALYYKMLGVTSFLLPIPFVIVKRKKITSELTLLGAISIMYRGIISYIKNA